MTTHVWDERDRITIKQRNTLNEAARNWLASRINKFISLLIMLESGGGGCMRAERACITHVAPDDKPLIPSALIFHNRITGALGAA